MSEPINKKEIYTSSEIEHKGLCLRFNERAKIIIKLSSKYLSNKDLQPTTSCNFCKCNLLESKNEKDTSCIMHCSVYEEYKNGKYF